MEELKITVEQRPGVITANFDEIKEALAVQMTAYEDYEVTEDGIPEAKKDIATLRKIRTAIDDRRKEIKKEFSKPLNDFEAEVKEMLSIIDKPINLINGKLDDFETARKEEKRKHLKELYDENIGEYGEFLPFQRIYNPKWENKGTSDKDILSELSEHKAVVRSNLDAIKALSSEIEEECIKAYKLSGNDLAAAIKKNSDYIAAKQMAEQRVREEQERKAEAERKAREEAEKQAQVEAEHKEEVKETPIVETVKEDLAVANEQVVSFVISGKDNIEKARMILNLEDIPYKEI